ncbi:MAG: T9SS type A sorting domain-containing protein [Bacteroidales bacterium]|nr:T9SS type A sorting domain-containing protein [Bacteroidales bacterium]
MRNKIVFLVLLTWVSFFNFIPIDAQNPQSNTSIGSRRDWLQMIQNPDVNFYEVQDNFNNYRQNRTDYKGNGFKVFKRWEYINRFRVMADGRLQAPDYVMKEYYKFMNEQPQNKSITGNWTSVGPNIYPVNATNQPNGMGRINAIAFHPTDAGTIYIGAPSGGLWKTINGGTSWVSLSSNLPTLGVSSILIHPSNPDIIYIGTGDRDADDAPGLGVFKSTDGGNSWAPINNSMGYVTVGAMVMHPSDPNIILAATSTGIYKTINAGLTWVRKSSNTAYYKDIKFKPDNASIIYATAQGKFYRSSNTGETWVQITSGIPSTGARQVIGVSADNPEYVYIAQVNSSQLYSGLYRSSDAGLNFALRSSTPSPIGYQCDGTDYSVSQAFYDFCITVDPTDAEQVYIGAINIWKSTDGGSTFSINSHWLGSSYGTSCAASVHADHHCLEWSPLTSKLFTGNDGGIHWTDNGGLTWTEITNNLNIAQVYKIGQSATNNALTINGYQDNGTSVHNGSTFTTVIGGDGTECAVDYTNESIRYGSYVFGDIYRSTGGNFNIISSGANGITENTVYLKLGAWVTPYILHRTNPDVMFAGFGSVWRTNNVKAPNPASVTWSAISTSDGTCYVIEQSPANTDILYVVRSGSLKRTDNANAAVGSVTWTSCNLPDGLTPVDIKAHPINENIVYAVAGYYIYKSTDKGTTWTNISGNLPALFINCMAYDKNGDEGIYIGNQTGVWYKDASMPNWVVFGQNLPPVDIRELEIYYDAGNPSNNRIKAATYGRGLWESDLIQYTVTDPSNINASAVSTSQIDLSWTKNTNNDNVMIAWSLTNNFGVPSVGSAYSQGNTIPGGGTVIYNGSGTSFNHSSLNGNTQYYYKVWSVNSSNIYSCGTQVNSYTLCNPLTSLSETFEGNAMPNCWSVIDNQGNGQIWKFGSYSNGTLPNLTNTYAYIHSADYGSGNAQNTDLISPTLDLTTYSAVILKFNQYYAHYTGTSANVYYSINNGASWTLLKTYTANTTNSESVGLNVPAAAGQSQVKFRWNFTSTNWGYYWSIDDVKVEGCSPGLWTGAFSTAWNSASNWCGLSVPTSTTDVFIPEGVLYMPLVSGTSGNNCRDISISSGATLSMHPTNASTLNVAGNWTNNGTFNCGSSTINFNGTTELQTIAGTSTTDFFKLTVAKGAQNRVLEALSVIGLTYATNPLTLTSGTFKLSSASTITPFTSGPTIPALGGFWNNGGTINAGGFSWTVTGLFRNSDGIINIGNATGNSLTYNTGSVIQIEGGTVNIAGRLSGTTSTTYNQTGGTLNVCTIGSTSTSLAPFKLTTGSSFTMSGGTIVIHRLSSNNTADYENLANTSNVTGGTLQIGNASTTGTPLIRISSTAPIYNFIINTDGGLPSAYIISNLTVKNNITVSGGGFSVSATNLTVNIGGDWNYSGGAPVIGGTINFNGNTKQNIIGNSITNFYNLTINNSHGIELSGSVDASVRNLLTLTSGVLKTNSNKLYFTLATGNVSRAFGHICGRLQKKVPTGTNVSKTFEVGGVNSTDYSPVLLTFAQVNTEGSMIASSVSEDHPDISSSKLFSGLSANRYWSLENLNDATVYTTYNATFNYLSEDLDNYVNTSNFICGKKSATWTYPTVGNKTSTSLQITGENGFGDFQIAETSKESIQAGGNWTDPATWNPTGVPGTNENVSITPPGTVYADAGYTACKALQIKSGATLMVNAGNRFTINETLINNSGNNGLVLASNSTGTASLLHNSDNINGTVQKYLHDSTTYGWYVSSPVQNAPLSCFNGAEAVFQFNSVNSSWNIVTDDTLSPLTGYVTKFGSGNEQNHQTVSFQGLLNNGNMTADNLIRTGYLYGNFGWQLIGNPYPCAIDWDLIVGGDNQNFLNTYNINPVIYVRKSNGSVAAYVANMGIGTNGGSRYIAPMQAFWVQVFGDQSHPTGNGFIEFSNNVRLHHPLGLLKSASYDGFKLKIESGSFSDELMIRFNSNATENFDATHDAVKIYSLNNNIPQIYSLSEDQMELAVNSYPKLINNRTVHLGFSTETNSIFTISADNFDALNPNTTVLIEDLYSNQITDLKTNGYTFSSDKEITNTRFLLHFNVTQTDNDFNENTTESTNIYAFDNTIYISNNTDDIVLVKIYNILGEHLFSQEILSESISRIETQLSQGLYIVKTGSNDEMHTKILFIR